MTESPEIEQIIPLIKTPAAAKVAKPRHGWLSIVF